MSQFLRDEIIKNINVDERSLDILNQYFDSRAFKSNQDLGDLAGNVEKILVISYIIRFDNKGYRFFDFKDVMKFYNQASDIERIIFTLESTESSNSNRNYGSYLELKLDVLSNCYLVASSDDENWADSAFSGVQELINKFHNKSSLVQNAWTYFLVQIFAVILGFVLSLWASIKISPYLTIDNAFVISFLFIFLLFSNSWTFINRQILRLINYAFPNLKFKRKGKETIHWLVQALIAGIILAITLFLLNKFFEFIGSVLGELINKNV